MPIGKPEDLAPETVVHRIGGGAVENLRLKPAERALTPPGISVLLGGPALEAAAQMRRTFPRARGLHEAARTVGSATAEAIRQAGFEIVPDPTALLPNHGRIIHRDGSAGFSEENLKRLAEVFQDTSGC